MVKNDKQSFLKNEKGFTLVEILVAVALMAVATTFMFMSYTNVMEEKRQESDLEVLNYIDDSLRQTFMQKDAFAEAQQAVYNKNDEMDYSETPNTLIFEFPVKMDDETQKGSVTFEEGIVKNNFGDEWPFIDPLFDSTMYHLENYTNGEKLAEHQNRPDVPDVYLESGAFKRGKYIITIEFNGKQVSSVRKYSISNDSMKITNSGASEMYDFED